MARRRNTLSDHRKLVAGLAATAVGFVVMLAGSAFVHAAESPEIDTLGNELWPYIPRGWVWFSLGQIVALGGVLLMLAGITYAFVYDRRLTWARASIGATVYVGLMLILFAIIPNQWLTLAQAELEWTPTKVFLTIPPALVLNNELSISYDALKDIISGTYSAVMLVVVAVAMVKWQNHTKEKAEAPPKPAPVSKFGRPMRVES